MEYIGEVIAQRSDVIGLLLLAIVFSGFAMERRPPVVIAVAGAILMLGLGYISTGRLLEVFGNKAPITIAAMFVITSSLIRTGILEAVAGFVLNRLRERPKLALAELITGTVFASGFVNNTPVVMIMIPIVKRLSKSIGVSVTRLLIPLSYISILGGTLTLIGTSTNLLVNGVAQTQGQLPFSFFEITGVGVIAMLSGLAFLAVFGKYLLPDRQENEAEIEDYVYLSELLIKVDSPWIGQHPGELELLTRPGVKILGIRHGKKVVRKDLDQIALKSGDRLLITANSAELASFNTEPEVDVGLAGAGIGMDPNDLEDPQDIELVGAVISANNAVVGRRLAEISLLSRLPVRILGLSRPRHVPGPDLSNARVKTGDRLLVAAGPNEARKMRQTVELVDVAKSNARAYQRRKAPIALLTLAAVVLGAAVFNIPIEALALAGVAVVLLFRCIEPEDAWTSIDGDTLVLIFAMLAFGAGLETAGTVDLIVENLAPLLSDSPPIVILSGIYLITGTLTAMVTNNAVAVIMTPLVIKLADDLGVDARQLVVAVMFAASASFATPIGYQTNTLVYGAANYRFIDFIKVGIPMSLVVGLATCMAIPLFF